MRLSLRTIRRIARLMLGLALFAQGVVAANACDLMHGNVEQAFAAKDAEMTAMHCHDETAPNANACFVHCTQGDQTSVDQTTPVFAAPSRVTLLVEVPPPAVVAPAYFTSRVTPNTGPPVTIRFCTYQI